MLYAAARLARVMKAMMRVLASLLLVSSALLFGCGESAREEKIKSVFAKQHDYRASPAQTAGTLARLKLPRGFSRSERCASPSDVCFARKNSVVPTRTEMNRLVAGLGARMFPASARCTRPKHLRAPGPAFLVCSARAKSGSDLLFVTLASVVVVTPTAVLSTTRRLNGGLGGSKINVADIGH